MSAASIRPHLKLKIVSGLQRIVLVGRQMIWRKLQGDPVGLVQDTSNAGTPAEMNGARQGRVRAESRAVGRGVTRDRLEDLPIGTWLIVHEGARDRSAIGVHRQERAGGTIDRDALNGRKGDLLRQIVQAGADASQPPHGGSGVLTCLEVLLREGQASTIGIYGGGADAGGSDIDADRNRRVMRRACWLHCAFCPRSNDCLYFSASHPVKAYSSGLVR